MTTNPPSSARPASARYRAVREVFHQALGRPAADRAEYLDEACAGDDELRSQVESLLASDSRAGGFLNDPAVSEATALHLFGAAVEQNGDALVGQRVGAYRVTGVIATGGMGRVYRAEQENPSRPVALKLLRGAVTPGALRRFEYEAQILARLRHPAIAQVYDAGLHESPSGGGAVPYFAMELVHGARPITDYVRETGRPARAWLATFIEACEGVHHGHQKGVVHRDLKPANILVDADGRVKVIDFGIARVSDSDVALTMMPTLPGGLVGTLAYMSPEQCAGDPREVDIRSDVYSLGVVLYELLTGATPHDVSGRTVPDAVRAIQEVPARRFPPGGPGDEDLRTITLKALEKPRERRYQSAADLAADLKRWLARQPISARPPTTLYQLRMFARRHRTLVGAAGTVAAVVVGALGATTWLYVDAVAARRLAERSGLLAKDEAAEATAVLGFMVEMLSSADPVRAKGENLTVREAFDAAAPLVEKRLADRPAVRAEVESTLGTIYRSMGALDRAVEHLREAHRLAASMHGAASAEAAEAATELGSVVWKLHRPEEAAALLDGAIASLRSAPEPEDARLARALLARGSMDLAYVRFDEGAATLREAVERARRARPPEARTLGAALEALASALEGKGDLEGARGALEESIDLLRREMGDDWPELASKMSALAGVHLQMGDAERGASLIDEAHARMTRAYGPEHRNTIAVYINSGDARARGGRHAEALAIYEQGLATLERTKAMPAYNVAMVGIKIGGELEALGRDEEALGAYGRAHSAAVGAVGSEHTLAAFAAGQRGVLLARLGRCGEALAALEPACAVLERGPIPMQGEHRYYRMQRARASCLESAGRTAEALAALETMERTLRDWPLWKAEERAGTAAEIERLGVSGER